MARGLITTRDAGCRADGCIRNGHDQRKSDHRTAMLFALEQWLCRISSVLSWIPDQHDRFYRVPFPCVGDGSVDIGEGVELHEAVKGEPTRPVQINQLGDKTLG